MGVGAGWVGMGGEAFMWEGSWGVFQNTCGDFRSYPPLKIDLQKIDPLKNRSGRPPKNCNFHILAPFQPFDLKTRLQGFLDPRNFSRRVPGPRISLKRPKMPKIIFYLPPGGGGGDLFLRGGVYRVEFSGP